MREGALEKAERWTSRSDDRYVALKMGQGREVRIESSDLVVSFRV